ncbi:MAG: ribosomal RNA small subunit methyltransferase J [Planctomycetota bacterium]|nr:MAG: ribosomal RNA small subunit methyltransferase J [Planctomycetota bacterium]
MPRYPPGVTRVTESLLRPAVCADTLDADPDLARWAALADWPVLPHDAFERAAVVLERDTQGLWLVGREGSLRGRAQVNLVDGALGDRLRRGVSTKEALARAVGARDGKRPAVVDLTLGWARDTALLSTLGCRVHARERSPVMAALLEDGLARAHREPRLRAVCERISWEFVQDDSALGFDAPNPTMGAAPVLLMDPMFPGRESSALVRLPLRLAAAVVGADLDATELLAAALAAPAARVVVRRPRGSPALQASRAPDLTVDGGRTTRFDVYLGRGGRGAVGDAPPTA